MSTGSIDHVAIATRSLEEAGRLFGDVLGAEFIAGGDDEELGIRTAQFILPPGVKIELMTPLHQQSYLHAFIEKHGEGFHHMTTFFEDLEALIADLDDHGFTTVDTGVPNPAWHETFIKPSAAFGALFQNVQTNRDWSKPHTHITFDDVLAGHVIWDGPDTYLREDDD